MKSKSLSYDGEQPRPARSCRIPQRGQSGSSQAPLTELCTTGDMSLLSTVGPANTTSTTLRLTQQYQTTAMTVSPWRATRMNLCSHQVSNCPVYPRASEEEGKVVVGRWRSHATSRTQSVPFSDNLHLENSFEDNGGSGQHVLDLLALEFDVFQRCLSAQPAPTALQRSNRGKCAHLLRDLAATAELPPHSAALLSAAAGFYSQVVVRC